ncbi:MAG: FmdB family zinc ribbon protein [Ilumatobacteraceae bacterium]
MPTYVYKFLETGETLEIQQSFSDATLTEAVHPETGATMAVKKVFQPVGVTFKGDGFYKTDSRGGSKATATTGGESSASSDSGTTSGSGAGTPSGDSKKTADSAKASSTSASSTSGSSTSASSPGPPSKSGKQSTG